MRLFHVVAYLGFIVAEVVKGSWQVVVAAVRRGGLHPDGTGPAIVELPLRCRTDLEISLMASSITITPGTIVVGTAAADASSPPTLFVHAVFGGPRAEILDGLRDMEARLLRATRGAQGGGDR